MRRPLLSALSALAIVGAMASTASASECLGLSCAGVVPAESRAHDPLLPTVASVDALWGVRASGFYTYKSSGLGQRVVAYVVVPGDWAATPAEIKQLSVASRLLPAELASKRMIFYGSAMESGPWAPQPVAATSRRIARRGIKARAAAASDCVSPYFCVFTDSSFGGHKCQWQDTGVWQSMAGTSCNLAASSMVNRRTAWSLIKRTDGRNYCAVPGSQDSSLSNNGFNDNTYETYNSTATTKQSGWNCAN